MMWQLIEDDPPQRGCTVMTKIDDKDGVRNIAKLRLDTNGRLWWLPDGSMYVYYVPTHWRPVTEGDK